MSSKNPAETARNEAREYVKLTRLNEANTVAKVVSKYQSEPRPRIRDGVHQVDGQGNQLFYDPRRTCSIVFFGGEAKDVQLSKDQFDMVKEGEMFLFLGRTGTVQSFGESKEGIIYDSVSPILLDENDLEKSLKLITLNEVNRSGTVVKKYQSEPRPRMKDGVQQVDAQGNPLFYEPRRTCDFIYTGGEAKNVALTKDQFDMIKEGEMYIFKGRRGTVVEFGESKDGILCDSVEVL